MSAALSASGTLGRLIDFNPVKGNAMRKELTVLAVFALASAAPGLAEKGGQHGKDRGDDYETQYRGEGKDCPPGLAKKQSGCQPHGQARKKFGRGEHLPDGYSHFTAYHDIPYRYRSRIRYGDKYRYIYQGDRVYVIDPTTRLIRDVIDLLR